jgi:putative solute:sodium symporter small subunit
MSENKPTERMDANAIDYWRASIRLIFTCLAIWFICSYGFGILFHDALNNIQIAGFKLGFWFAQNGSIYVFLGLIFWYAKRMDVIDREHGVHED